MSVLTVGLLNIVHGAPREAQRAAGDQSAPLKHATRV